MDQNLTDVQRNALFRMLDEVMVIMLDDKPFNPDGGVFGKVDSIAAQPGYPGGMYSFDHADLPTATIEFLIESNPLDYSEDRMKVPVVPTRFNLNFDPPIYNLTEEALKKRLDLADYWVDRDGTRHEGNVMPPAGPGMLLQRYRYRANAHTDGRFPVNVEIALAQPSGDEPESQLMYITIGRAYLPVSSEDRKKIREEKEQRVRELSGNPGAAK